LNAQNSDKEILLPTEINPEYPGGEAAMNAFISKNIKYPNKEKENNVVGKVIARFAVMEDGTVDKITILSQTPLSFNNEVIRVLKLMPKWKPGMQYGKPVIVYFTLPIMFQMDNNENNMQNVIAYIGTICGIAIGILIYKLIF
jgi:protein TonB